MPTVAVLPVKPFQLGKERLAESLGAEARIALAQAFAIRTADTAASAGLIPLIVAGDYDVAEWALIRGIPTVDDPGNDLNAAAAAGVEWARSADCSWIVVHCDLPLLQVHELGELTSALATVGTVIAPSADGGTSALGGTEPVEFSYGPGSFHRHLARNRDAAVLARIGLLHDVDSPADLISASRHPRGKWLASVLG
ncbi:MAG: 2-phospho-L-lactate guanylyltransferase [Actinomycetota bacterium]|nr:2-phospho-L-lactate guanylyltransferase [Actinomycetota bacterium]